jgi:hypothetical protein
MSNSKIERQMIEESMAAATDIEEQPMATRISISHEIMEMLLRLSDGTQIWVSPTDGETDQLFGVIHRLPGADGDVTIDWRTA